MWLILWLCPIQPKPFCHSVTSSKLLNTCFLEKNGKRQWSCWGSCHDLLNAFGLHHIGQTLWLPTCMLFYIHVISGFTWEKAYKSWETLRSVSSIVFLGGLQFCGMRGLISEVWSLQWSLHRTAKFWFKGSYLIPVRLSAIYSFPEYCILWRPAKLCKFLWHPLKSLAFLMIAMKYGINWTIWP